MDPVTAAILIPALVGTVSSLVQAGNNADAQKTIDEAVKKYGPEARDLIEKELGGPSAMAEVYGEKLAPEAAAAQKNALARLQQVTEKGYTAEEQAALNRIQQQSAAQAAQQQAALKSQMARRGVAGTGQELAMNLANLGQQSAQQYQAGLDVAANAQRRAFQAMQAQGQLGGQMRGQSFEEGRTRAAADEARRINRARMKTDVMGKVYDMTTNAARSGAEVANQPWRTTSEVVGRAGQTYASYAGAPAARKKPYDPNDPSTW